MLRSGCPPRRRDLGVYPDNLSEREVDVLVRIAQGHSRQKIAGDLVLGQRTVAGHMTSILDKIGVGDEDAAKAYTLGQGLTSRVGRGSMPNRRRRRRERFAQTPPSSW